MMYRKTLLTLMFALIGSAAYAESGTPDEQAACRPDVRRFCANVPKNAADGDFLACLENNRDQLTPKCLAVLVDHGR